MSVTTAPLRIAVAQQRVHWTLHENLAGTLRLLSAAAAQGAQLCVFGELSLTGYHRQIAREADPERVGQGLQAVQAACARLGLAAAVGAPTWAEGQPRPLNSHLLFGADGGLLNQVDKDGLTLVETFFFQPGQGRPAATLRGLRCTTVLCREVEEDALLAAQLPAGHADLVLWPSLADMQADDSFEARGQAWARRSSAWWVQCNAPNAPNTPTCTGLGGSVVLSPAGHTVLRLPADEAGLAVFTLGDAHFDWQPEAVVPA